MRGATGAGILAVLAACALAACGAGSSTPAGNGVASMAPQQILAATARAAAGLRSVHINGHSLSPSEPLSMDVTLTNGGGEGTIIEDGNSLQVRSIGTSLYIKASAGFWKRYSSARAAAMFSGKWLKTPQKGPFSALGTLTDKQTVLDQMLSNNGSVTKGSLTRINGHAVVGLLDAHRGGTLYVATQGKPYPIEIVGSGTKGGRVVFDHFNVPVTISVPPHAITLYAHDAQ